MSQTTEEIREKVYNQAIKLLSLRAHTEFELSRKLLKKKYAPELVSGVVGELRAKKYLDDEAFARTFLENLIKYKSFGYYGLQMKLAQRGLAKDLAVSLLDEYLDVETEAKIAEKFLGKKRAADKTKAAQALQRKGFRSQIIARIVGDWQD